MNIDKERFPSLSISAIPHLAILQSRIRQSYEEQPTSQAVELAIEQLPYALDAAASALVQIAEAEGAAAESVTKRATEKVGRLCIYQLENFEYRPIAFAVDTYLDSARRAQNAMSPYLSKVLRVSIPESLSNLVARLRNSRISLPQRVHDLVESYWFQSGERLKLYRDLSQHHAVVSSDGRVALLPDGRRAVYQILPNNPWEKDLAKLCYLDPRIDALPYAIQSYCELYAFVFELTHVLLSYTTDPGFMSFTFPFKGPLRMGSTVDGNTLVPPKVIVTTIKSLQADLTKRLDAELPREEITPALVYPT